jgi:alpha-L-rhamnosidase
MPFAAAAGSDPADNQPWNAKWCWTTARLPRPWNTYVLFRKVIELSDRSAAAVVRVSADARYVLFVNGRRVHQGPARCFPHAQSYDTLDLADFLTAGVNSICAVVHQFGLPTAQSVYRDASGFLLDGVIEAASGEAIGLHTPDGWLCREALGWRKHVARISAELGFQEHFDADADPPDWMMPEYAATEDAGWRPPVTVAQVNGQPWVSMRPRGVPLLASGIASFSAIVAQFTGENARGYKVAEDIYHHAIQETRKKVKAGLELPDAMLKDDDQVTILAPPPDGQFHLAVLDLGLVHTAHMILDLADAAGDEIIDVLYLGVLEKTGAPLLEASGEYAPADRYRCRPGAQRWESFWPKGFRYAALIFRNIEKPLKIRHVGARTVHAALERLGSFKSSDERLDAIYEAAAATLCACTLDAYVDAPSSQSQQWSHARVVARAAAGVFGDQSLMARGIVQMALSQASDGAMHGHPPSDDPSGWGLDAMFAWIGTLWEHCFHGGQTELLLDCRASLDRLLEFLAAREGSDGFGQLPPDGDDARAATINLLYLQSLRWSAGIYRDLKLEKDGARLARKAEALAKSIERQFWDDKEKVWKDNTTSDQISVDTNALAVLLDLRPDDHAAIARDVIHKTLTARRGGKIIAPSPATTAHALDALIHAGLRAEAIDLLRAKWDQWTTAGGGGLAAMAAVPLYLLPQQILGVIPIEVGWQRVRIAPLVAGLEFARGVVPSPHGLIRVEWEKVGDDQLAVRVDLPEGIEGEFVGPLGERRALETGGTEFHT